MGPLRDSYDPIEAQQRQRQQSQEGSFSAGEFNPGTQQPAQDGVDGEEEVEGVERVAEVERVDGVNESGGVVVGVEQQCRGGGGTNMDTEVELITAVN